MGEDRPIGGYGIPSRTEGKGGFGLMGDLDKPEQEPIHPVVRELQLAIEELKDELKEQRATKDLLFKQIEEMVAQAKEHM